jgi:hypothetical protein
MKNRGGVRTALIAVLLLGTFHALVPRTALAYSYKGCNPNRDADSPTALHHYDGWERTPSDNDVVGGATVTVPTYMPYTGTTNSSEWSMLVHSQTSNTGFSQVGYQDAAGTPQFFAEYQYADGSTFFPIVVYPSGSGITAPTQDVSYSYNSLYENTAGEFTFTIKVGSTSYPAVAAQNNQWGYGFSAGQTVQIPDTTFTPYGVQIAGETKDRNMQMFGDRKDGIVLDASGYWDTGSPNSGPIGWQTMGTGVPSMNTNADIFGGVALSANQYEIWDSGCPVNGDPSVFQSNGGNLYYYTPSGGGVNTSQGMATGTSPSVTTADDGSWTAAFQNNGNNLYTYTSAGTSTNRSQGMKAGTSPSITMLSNGTWVIAFQANSGNLYTYTSGGTSTNTGQGMAPGTSPSITATGSGGWTIAFQANNNNLYTYTSGGTSTNTSQGMKASTSPSITTLTSGATETAFQNNGGNLYTYTGSTATNTSQGMDTSSSPSICWTTAGGWVAAFQSNGHVLFTYTSSATSNNTSQGMESGTSPSIASFSSGYATGMAFEANNTDLYNYTSYGGVVSTALGMSTTTSPGISA